MDSHVKSPYTKRFVVENSVTKVTSDGEPHEMMTMIAVLAGLFAAVVILAILVSLVSCKKNQNTKACKNCSAKNSPVCSRLHSLPVTPRTSISTIYNGASSTPITPEEIVGIRYTPVKGVNSSSGNLSSNLNKAFESSEYDLSSLAHSKSSKKKTTHWIDEQTEKPLETHIDIEMPGQKY